MKKYLILILSCAFLAASCDKMDSNYRHYIDDHLTYSPKVDSLAARSSEVGSLTLRWKLPASSLPKTIEIVCEESSTVSETLRFDGLVTVHTVTGLKEQGYTFKVYTKDVFGNLSVPVSHTFNPIPHREGNDAGDDYEDDERWFDPDYSWYGD